MWSNLELSSTLFELGWARMPGGSGGGGRDQVSRALGHLEEIRTFDRQPNQLGALIGQGGSSRFSLPSAPCKETARAGV